LFGKEGGVRQARRVRAKRVWDKFLPEALFGLEKGRRKETKEMS
jgi:hypothetical protein